MPLTDAQQRAAALLATKELELNQAKQAYAEVNPQGAMDTKIAEDNQSIQNYIQTKRNEAQQAYDSCMEAGNALHSLQTVSGPSQRYTQTLQQQAEHLTKEQSQLTQKIRTQRRSFLDAFPQAGTGGRYRLPHTSDDFAMILFFIGFAAAYGVLFAAYVPPSSYKVVVGILLFVILWLGFNRIVLTVG